MAKIETLTAYKCTFSYLERNNPLKEELKDKIKSGDAPEYVFSDFIGDFCAYTSSLILGKSAERAILLPTDHIIRRNSKEKIQRWRLVPYAGKRGKPFRIVKYDGKKYDFGSDSTALYEHNVFIYQDNKTTVAIFHRQSGSGCKSVFQEVANKMLREKGIKLEMELYLPLLAKDTDIVPTNIQLQYIRTNISTDDCENMNKRKRKPKNEIIRNLGLNLESSENQCILDVIQERKLGKIDQNVAFARIKALCKNADMYNNAEICFRIGKRHQTVPWNEFDSIIGNYDITVPLHDGFQKTGDFICTLTEITDEYFESIVSEENKNAR